jgi:hypothetical protein
MYISHFSMHWRSPFLISKNWARAKTCFDIEISAHAAEWFQTRAWNRALLLKAIEIQDLQGACDKIKGTKNLLETKASLNRCQCCRHTRSFTDSEIFFQCNKMGQSSHVSWYDACIYMYVHSILLQDFCASSLAFETTKKMSESFGALKSSETKCPAGMCT